MAKVLKGKCDFTASSSLIKLSTLFLSLYYHVSFSDPPPALNLKH